MKSFFQYLFIRNWPRKLVALIAAIFMWLLVHQTITIERTIPDVCVNVINLPHDKTVLGLLPNGMLNKRIAVTVTGARSIVEELQPTDLNVIINADGHKESWIATIDKRNLISLNQEVDLKKHITHVSANDLFIQLSKLITEEIPLTIMKPIGDPPKGFQYLNVWPKYLIQKVSGPEEQLRILKERGLELTFNLNKITKEELLALYNQQEKRDEITFKIPDAWKEVPIPFKDNALEALNDPRAKLLRIDFLKQELLPLGTDLPITIFFPPKYSRAINPQTYSLATNDIVQRKNGLKHLVIPLYVRDVSNLFLNVVRDNLLILVTAAPKNVKKQLPWAVEFIDEKELENAFIEAVIEQNKEKYDEDSLTKYTDEEIRNLFRNYLRKLVLLTEDGQSLQLKIQINANTIIIEQKKA